MTRRKKVVIIGKEKEKTLFSKGENILNIYIVKEKKFEFENKASYDLPIMGVTSMEMLLSEFPEAAQITEEEYDLRQFDCSSGAMFIKSAYPSFNRKSADKILEYFSANKLSVLKFKAGLVVGKEFGGEADSVEISCGTPLDALASYSVVVDEIRKNVIAKHIQNGVLIETPASVYIAPTVKIEAGATIRHDVHIMGESVIKSGAVVMPYSNITDSVIGRGSLVTSSTLVSATVGDDTTVGPNAYLRPDAVIGDGCRIGDFVEIKNAKIGDGTKVSHLSYVGDADVGKNVNVGCGVVFVNYDGRNKHRSVVGNDCFIGSNCNLVAPVRLEDNSFVAAGTTLTQNLKSGDFCIGRMRETIKPDRAYKYYGKKTEQDK